MSITSKTQLLGLFGWPVSHSFSPAMHNAAIAQLGIDYVYLPLPVAPDQLGHAVAGLTAMGFHGVNVTIPHKQAIVPYLATVSEAAQAIGAVNTLVRRTDGRFDGHNTDWSGFSADLAQLNTIIQNRDAIVLGAGGSARAVVYALLKQNARVFVLARRPEASAALCADMANWFPDAALSPGQLTEIADLSTDSPLIINTTPLGMHPNTETSAWPADVPMPAGSFVYDLVYNPAKTRIMQQAEANGCDASNGIGMLLYQGVHAFELWTGETPDITVMSAALPFS